MQLRMKLTPQRSTAVSLAPADGQVHFVMSTCSLSQSTSHPYLHPPTPPTPHPCSHSNHNADDDNDDSVEMLTVTIMMKRSSLWFCLWSSWGSTLTTGTISGKMIRYAPSMCHLQDAPLVVMNNFGAEEHLKLTTALFQNLFPAINVHSVSLKQCKVSL